MAIKWGSTYVTAVKWGNTTCTQVKWGSTKVFPGGGNGYNGSTFDYPFQSGFTNNQTSGTITSGAIEFNFSKQFSKGGYGSWTLLTSINTIDFSNYSTVTVAWTETYGTGTQGDPNSTLTRRIFVKSSATSYSTMIYFGNNGVAVALNTNMQTTPGQLIILYEAESSIRAWVYWSPFKITKILLS